jgi:hypothetical protein
MTEKKFNIPDVDIDVSDKTRAKMLESLTYVPASKITDKSIVPHNVGVYFCDIPQDKISGLASIDYKRAEEEFGFIKTDILHNSIYDRFESRHDIEKILEEKPDWSKLYKKDIVESLPHINSYYTLINDLPKIDSVENLARLLAIIRPGKQYLIDTVKNAGNWESIDDKIWTKEDKGYCYKHSHAIAFALSIVVAMSDK